MCVFWTIINAQSKLNKTHQWAVLLTDTTFNEERIKSSFYNHWWVRPRFLLGCLDSTWKVILHVSINHTAHLATVMVSRFRSAAATRICVLHLRNRIFSSCALYLFCISCWISSRQISFFIAALRELMGSSTILRKGEQGGSIYRYIWFPGDSAWWWGGTPSKITHVSSSCKASAQAHRNWANRSWFIPPIWVKWCTRPSIGDTARVIITLWPFSVQKSGDKLFRLFPTSHGIWLS